MKTHSILATCAATLGAVLVLASADALAGKPTPSTEPCAGAEARGFPALVFTRQRQSGGHVYHDTILSDLTGQCQQTVYVADWFAQVRVGDDVNLRYDAATHKGYIVRTRGGGDIVASTYTVSFNASGVPTVTSDDYSPVLALDALPTPEAFDGWSKYLIAYPTISPDGRTMLVTVAFHQVQGTRDVMQSTYWTCTMASPPPAVVASTCGMAISGVANNVGGWRQPYWGGRSDVLYIVDTPADFSTGTLSRLDLQTGVKTQIWSPGFYFGEAKGTLVGESELVALRGGSQELGCIRVLVIDADSCDGNGCTILNGAGSPARGMTWLPNGRLAGEGQTSPNRKGRCSASGSIVVFDPLDPNGFTTTLSPSGVQPDGANGG